MESSCVIASLGKRAKYIGIDIDEYAISEATASFGDSIDFEAKSLLSVDADNEFDLVILGEHYNILGRI